MQPHAWVVDDEPDFVELMSHGLRTNGFECSEAFNGMEALDKALEHTPDVVILDIMRQIAGAGHFGFASRTRRLYKAGLSYGKCAQPF